ncbi:hypothetical protein PG985_008248 [Apiospora marii]|uniref:uncharacterized protein n=1 Tax=Apiospora marii TaxID=335849 RepID=UPI00312DC33E
MGSPVSTAVAAGASASANRSPAAFDDMTDATSQIAGNSNSYTTNGQSCGMEMIAAGLNMYGDKPDAARTGGSVRPPHDEEKANLYIINAASKERFSHMTCENWEEASPRPFCACLKFVALWLVFAVIMWLFLPLFFCLGREEGSRGSRHDFTDTQLEEQYDGMKGRTETAPEYVITK